MRILFTGGSGFIGRRVTRFLEQSGHEVHIISRRENPTIKHLHLIDLFDTPALYAIMQKIQPEGLLHLAWETEHGKFWNAPSNVHWLAASLVLFQMFVECGGKQIVSAGSCAEYTFDNAGDALLSAPPSSLYGLTKKSLHDFARSYLHSTSVLFSWGRIFFPYGPEEKRERLIPSLVNSLLVSEPFHCQNPNQQLDLIHVDDVARAFVFLIEHKVSGTYDLCTGKGTPIATVADQIAQKLNKQQLVTYNGCSNDSRRLIGDPAELTNITGWSPSISLIEGITKSIEWWSEK